MEGNTSVLGAKTPFVLRSVSKPMILRRSSCYSHQFTDHKVRSQGFRQDSGTTRSHGVVLEAVVRIRGREKSTCVCLPNTRYKLLASLRSTRHLL